METITEGYYNVFTDVRNSERGTLRIAPIWGGLNAADLASFMPRITVGNTMAPCVVIGERAADMIGRRHGLARAGTGVDAVS